MILKFVQDHSPTSSHCRGTAVPTETQNIPAASILLVEDNEPIRVMAVRILEEAGYRVRQAANAREGASMIDVEDPDIVITDIFMPEGDGFEMMRELRRRDRQIPVIVMSGGGQGTDLNFLGLADRLGAAVVLAKPFRRQQLLDAVEQVLAPRSH